MKETHSWRRYGKGVLALFFCWSVTTVPSYAIDFMPVADVHTGMEGIAKTVVVGDTISTFNVRVLGVMKDRGPSGDLVLAKFSGPIMDQTGGIAHGMSGSPVYINGKLLGAVAYGWGFADGTIGMITPIEDMVKLWNIPYEKKLANPWKDDKLIPMGTPLMAYGFDRKALDFMSSKLPKYSYETYDTAAASSDNQVKPLQAGGSVAALLVDGDLKLGAIGTVTYVDGDRVVAFGHPFLKRGSAQYFMHNSSIFTVVKSVESAFKLGSMGAEVGTVNEDRGAGIAGVSHEINGGIPVALTIRDLDTGKERTAHVKVIEDGDMTPTLGATVLYSFLNKTMDRIGDGTATVTYTITPKGTSLPTLTRKNMFYSHESISEKSVDELYKVLDALMNNPFLDFEIDHIDIEADVTEARKTAKIIDAKASPIVVAPGDTIVVDVQLHPFRGNDITKEIFYKVPKNQKMGKASLEVRGGGVIPLPYVFEKQKYNLTDEIIRRLKNYKDFDEFFQEINHADANHQIVVEILEDGVSMIDDDKTSGKKVKLDDVESSHIPGTIQAKNSKELVETKDDTPEDKAVLDTEYIIQGDGQFTITVMSPKQRDKALAKLKKHKAQAASISNEVEDPNGQEKSRSEEDTSI